jgi:hypothetical protein
VSASEATCDLIFTLIDGFIEDPKDGASLLDSITKDIIDDLEQVLNDNRVSYRDGVMIQLAFGLHDPALDLTRRPAGGRSVAQRLGDFLASRHIRCVKDAYQNIAKNTDVLTRGNFEAFDRILIWANAAGSVGRDAALRYACAKVASTARPVTAMPVINRSVLTFSKMSNLFDEMLATQSGGAFEQFIVAALLNSLVSNHGENRTRVETKNLNASDRSSFAAGDVQIVGGGRVIDAIEVTANDWRTKISSAFKTIRDNDLSRLHIVASRPDTDRKGVAIELQAILDDISILDVRQVLDVVTAVLTRPQRAEALGRLYEYLDRYQADSSRVNFYVEKLTALGLVEPSGN